MDPSCIGKGVDLGVIDEVVKSGGRQAETAAIGRGVAGEVDCVGLEVVEVVGIVRFYLFVACEVMYGEMYYLRGVR